MKKDCPKYEVNLALIPNHTWWIDTGATTHISVTM